MKYGPIVAKRFEKQYCKRNRWEIMKRWEIQPEQLHLILCELTSKEAINALLGNSAWTKRLPKAGAK